MPEIREVIILQRNSCLLFTAEERATPALEKPIRRAEEAADRLRKIESSIPKQTGRTKKRTADPKTGMVTVRLHFEEVGKKKPPAKLTHAVWDVPGKAVLSQVHRAIQQSESDNVGVEAAHKVEESTEFSARAGRNAYRSHKLKPYRETAKAEKQLDKANVRYMQQKAVRDSPQFSSNPISRLQQKQAIKREYAAAKFGKYARSAQKTTASVGKVAQKAGEGMRKVGMFIAQHKKVILIVGCLFLVIVFLVNTISSCSVLFQAGIQSVAATTYPTKDEIMLGAEAAYTAMEAELQNELDNYESLHPGYDEYHFDLDEIEHDPYVLISIIAALHGDFTLDEIQNTLSMLFDKQYILTQTVKTEVQYRAETTASGDVTEVAYNYNSCYVKLENFNLSHVPIYIMSEDELGLYAMYISTHGNRPDLFPQSQYPYASVINENTHYDVPKQYLEDKTFAAILAEAEKYLGYPYVWGGYNPTTSFDCSGFVSWVLTNSGVLNTGRLGAQGLYSICTSVSIADAKPGDLVFFAGTYDVTGVSHVGICVGDGMMIQAGNPIGYASIETSYWQSHFYAFGRLPII